MRILCLEIIFYFIFIIILACLYSSIKVWLQIFERMCRGMGVGKEAYVFFSLLSYENPQDIFISLLFFIFFPLFAPRDRIKNFPFVQYVIENDILTVRILLNGFIRGHKRSRYGSCLWNSNKYYLLWFVPYHNYLL